MIRRPGEVVLLPADEHPDGDPKPRPHLLLTTCDDTDPDGVCTVAYCSTKGVEEATFGAEPYLIDPSKSHARRSGFAEPTYVHTARLIAVSAEYLPAQPLGMLADDMVGVKQHLRKSLGIGTGTGHQGLAKGTLRGVVVTLKGPLVEQWECRYATIITEPTYSLQERYQLLLPMLPVADFAPRADELVVDAGDSLAQIGLDGEFALSLPLLQYEWHAKAIADHTGCVTPHEIMDHVDLELANRFGL